VWLLVSLQAISPAADEEAPHGILSVSNNNWKVLLDFLDVLPFVQAQHILDDSEILGRIDEFKGTI
jgi:hypothetical protein